MESLGGSDGPHTGLQPLPASHPAPAPAFSGTCVLLGLCWCPPCGRWVCFYLAVSYQHCVYFPSLQGVLTPLSHAPLCSVLVGLHLLSPLHCHWIRGLLLLPPHPLALSSSLAPRFLISLLLTLTLTLSLTGYYTLLLFSLSSSLFQGETTHNAVLRFLNAPLLRAQEALLLGCAHPLGARVQPEACRPADLPHPGICLSTCCNAPPSVQSLSRGGTGARRGHGLSLGSFGGPGCCQAIQCHMRVT